MRIDKYLWCIRRFKTRSLATDAVRKEKIVVNNELAKASRNIKTGDIIELKADGIVKTYKVLDIPKSRVGAKLLPEYMEDKTTKEELDKEEFMRLMKKMDRRKGTGRPTKKERRDIDRMKE